MTMRSKKEIQNQSQTGYMQSNQPQTAGGEAGKRNRIKTHSQSGRSMVEMLGVLAIIAVLSIGGIVGFRLAMNYYQANQIAHEMNMMRTDAQIKIAQGTEKLILGSPYDPISESQLGHIQFNDAYPVDFACALADDETVELSNISCHVANAYYIELQNIPEGVCRPLAELVNGMNNIIAFNVNKNEYPGEGKCEAGNENVLNAVFSAEAVSELVACAEDTDCESENASYCDPSRHVCVKCYEDSQCAHNQYCENNTCVTCESGVWNGEECVECTADDDCTDTPDTPKCNTDTNTCVECVESGDCEESLVCRENTCSLCETEEECQAKGENYHCSNASICIQCLDNQVWNDKSKECVECTEDNDCADTPDTPKCNTTTNQCVECIESSNCSAELVCRENTCSLCETEEECQAKGENYHCSKEDTCIQCPANQVWDNENRECVECTADNDCADTPDTPKCNTTTNQCVECTTNENCFEKDIKKPVCNTEQGICEPCPNEGEVWNEEQQKCAPVVCKTNAECFEHLNQNYYCDKTPVDSCGENETGTCKKFELDLHGPVNGVLIDASAQIYTTYWNDCRICEANAGQDGARCSDNSYLSPYMLNMNLFTCADKFDPSAGMNGFCHEEATGNRREFDRNNISRSVQNLREFFRCTKLPDPDKNVCTVSPVLAEYNSERPCDAYRITMYDIDETGGEFAFCTASGLGGKKHGHRGIICKK